MSDAANNFLPVISQLVCSPATLWKDHSIPLQLLFAPEPAAAPWESHREEGVIEGGGASGALPQLLLGCGPIVNTSFPPLTMSA